MKITIVTPFDSANFGAYLQAYCLKTVLERQGHDVSHVLTRDEGYVRNLYYHDVPCGKREMIFKNDFENQKEYGKKKYSIFKDAQKYFKVVDSFEKTDLVIVGSDEIWNVRKPVFQKPIFWGDISAPTISYATSIGNAKTNEFCYYPDQLQQLTRLSSVLVRDKNTFEFVEKYGVSNPKMVCDPTILLPVNEYGNELKDDFVKNNRCLLIYAYRLKKKTVNAIKRYAKKQGLKTVACCFYHPWCDYQCDCGPLEFSSLIRQCEKVITTTFHGCIFSFLNHADFVCIPHSIKSNQLLEQFDISDRILSSKSPSCDAIERVFSRGIDYSKIDEKIFEWRHISEELLAEAITKSQNDTTKYDSAICFSANCTGCLACAEVCPQKAISMQTDAQGRILPQVDMEKCIKCGKCKRICPQRSPVVLEAPRVCYANQRVEKEKRKKSSSGGIGAVLAENFTLQGNVACGAIVDKGKVYHKCITDLEEVDLLRGSKYVQSRVDVCYGDIRQKLQEGKKVLFFGTPCQVAAARKLFENMEGFYCVDIVCHGVPPMLYLQKHFEAVLPTQEIEEVTFRGNPKDYVLKVSAKNKVIYEKEKNADKYYYAFMKGLICRENCYNCIYAQAERSGDLTIGDFWKLDRASLVQSYEGKISLTFVNTQKGEELFKAISQQLVFEEREIGEAVRGNSQLYIPPAKHKKRELFMRKYMETQDFEEALDCTKIKNEMNMLILKRSVKAFLKKMTGRG